MSVCKYHNPNDNWYYDNKLKCSGNERKACFWCIVGMVVVILVSLLLSSCSTVEYIPVETVRTEYVNKTDTFIKKDSVVCRDSIYLRVQGDTVYYERWHTKYQDRIVTKIVVDSFIKTDSVQVPYPVERRLTKWQSIKMDVGGFAIGTLLFVIVLVIIVWLVKMKK